MTLATCSLSVSGGLLWPFLSFPAPSPGPGAPHRQQERAGAGEGPYGHPRLVPAFTAHFLTSGIVNCHFLSFADKKLSHKVSVLIGFFGTENNQVPLTLFFTVTGKMTKPCMLPFPHLSGTSWLVAHRGWVLVKFSGCTPVSWRNVRRRGECLLTSGNPREVGRLGPGEEGA